MSPQHSTPTPRAEKKMLFLGSSFQGCLIFSEDLLKVSSHYKDFTAHLCIIACFKDFLGHYVFFLKLLRKQIQGINCSSSLISKAAFLIIHNCRLSSYFILYIQMMYIVKNCYWERCSAIRQFNIWSSFSSFNSLLRQYYLVMRYTTFILQVSFSKYLGLLGCCDKPVVKLSVSSITKWLSQHWKHQP